MGHHSSIAGMAGSVYETRPNVYPGGAVKRRAAGDTGFALQEMPREEQAAYISYQNKALQDVQCLRVPHCLPDLDRFARTGGAPGSRQGGAECAVTPETQVLSINEDMEGALIHGANHQGKMIHVHRGTRGSDTLFTVHGIMAAPDTLDSIHEQAAEKGGEVNTFAYDDKYRRLTDSSRDLAEGFSGWMRDNPGRPLNIVAHSMGSRITLGALQKLDASRQLEDRQVNLSLLAPALGGYKAANLAQAAPSFLAGIFKGAVPGKDMGTESYFQTMLESNKLPDNVRTTIFQGTDDTTVDEQSEGYRRIAGNLNAEIVMVEGAGHDTIIDAYRQMQDPGNQ